MKQARLARRMLLALLMPAVGYCTYPTVEEAQSLFTAELMNSTNVIFWHRRFRGACRASPAVPVLQGLEHGTRHLSRN